MSSGHGHDHPHDQARDFSAIFAAATILNIGLVVVQVVYGILADSVALLADAGHNFGDVLGLVIAWAAHVAAARQPTRRYTYGFRAASILATIANAVILLVATGAIAWEAIQRLFQPVHAAGMTIMMVAAIGIVVNGISAWLLLPGQKGDLNIKGAFFHLLGDAAVSVGVVIAGALILLTQWTWIDPAVSLAISGLIAWSTWSLLRDSVNLSLNAVPQDIDPEAVRRFLECLPEVSELHDLHIWAIGTTERALTCHLVMPNGHPGDEFFERVYRDLHDQFQIGHPTLQIERSADRCKLAPDHVV